MGRIENAPVLEIQKLLQLYLTNGKNSGNSTRIRTKSNFSLVYPLPPSCAPRLNAAFASTFLLRPGIYPA